jgi:hypothetical protein
LGEDPEALKANAVVPRDAGTLSEAEAIVRNSETGFLNKPLTNRIFDITAAVSGKSLDEMTGEKPAKRAVSPRLQAKAAANADILFERAVIHAAHPDTHKREGVVQVHRFGALLEDGGEYVPVKLTVIEYEDKQTGNRLYAIEAVDVEKMKSAGLMPAPSGNPETSGPIADFTTKLLRLAEIVSTPEEKYGLLY